MSRPTYGSKLKLNDRPSLSQSLALIPNGPYYSLTALADALQNGRNVVVDEDTVRYTALQMDLVAHEAARVPLLRPQIGIYARGGTHDLPSQFRTADDSEPIVALATVLNIEDKDERKVVQRAAARGILETLRGVDGYNYTLNNAWGSKDAGGYRFSYTCNNSINIREKTASTSREQRGFAAAIPPDCNGSVSMKFDRSRARVEIYYRHLDNHEYLPSTKQPFAAPGHSTFINAGPIKHITSAPSSDGSLKRKRDGSFFSPIMSQPSEPSLRDLLLQSEAETFHDDDDVESDVPSARPRRFSYVQQAPQPPPPAVITPSRPPQPTRPPRTMQRPAAVPPAVPDPFSEVHVPPDKSLFLTLKPMFNPVRFSTPQTFRHGPK